MPIEIMDPGQAIQYSPPGQVQELQDRFLNRTLRIARTAHPHYASMLQNLGLKSDGSMGLEALKRLPITHKRDFLENPEGFRLQHHPDLTAEERALREVFYTTGTTTGVPAPIYNTTSDHYSYLIHCGRVSEMSGITSADRIANVFPLTTYPMGAYVLASAAAAAAGASIVNTHTGQRNAMWPVHRRLDEAIQIIEQNRSTVIWGISGFVRRLLIRASEIGADFSSLRICIVTGEATTSDIKRDMERLMGEIGSTECLVLNRYGSTEAGSLIQCTDGANWHNASPDMIHIDIVDPDTHEPLGDREPGLIVITHLHRTGTLLLRYALGDIVELDRSPCPQCGRTAERVVSSPIRTKDLVKVKGTLVNVAALCSHLDGIQDLISYQIVIEKPSDDLMGSDRIRVRIAPRGDRDIAVNIETLVRKMTHVTPSVEIHDANDIYDPEVETKPEKVVDMRSGA